VQNKVGSDISSEMQQHHPTDNIPCGRGKIVDLLSPDERFPRISLRHRVAGTIEKKIGEI
jgi:hypothetical protein